MKIMIPNLNIVPFVSVDHMMKLVLKIGVELPADHQVTELWQVITDVAKGRRGPGQVTLFDSVGFAIEDFSALRYVRDQLASTGLYQQLDMLADPDEPRDLFGMLLRAAVPVQVASSGKK